MKKLSNIELELSSILAEINQQEATELSSILAEINQQEATELPEEYANGSWEYVQENGILVPSTKKVADEARKRALETKQKNAIDRKRKKQEIINEAINSTFIDLNSPLTVYHKKMLISILTKQYTDCMKKHEFYINNSIEKLLKMLIPNDLLDSWNKYKDVMIPSPGFMYTASKEYGNGLTFKVTLNLPMYFQQNAYMNILKEHFSYRLPSIDKAVAFFYKHKDIKTKQEIKYAQSLTKINTFFQLVKYNAFWYEKLVNNLKTNGHND